MKSQTTKDVLGLAMHKDCVGVLLLTGTPMKNGKPSNLFPLLKIIKHDLGKHEKKYEERYCNGQYKQFGRGPKIWDAGGKSNEEELKDLMGDYMLRKTKEECLDLKEKVREFKKVEVPKKAWIDEPSSAPMLPWKRAGRAGFGPCLLKPRFVGMLLPRIVMRG